MIKTSVTREKILVTGGTGYIGSHTAVELIQQGYQVVLLDNLSNSNKSTLQGIAEITSIEPQFEQADVCNLKQLRAIFDKHRPNAVIHFAGLKAVGESMADPLRYYQNNFQGSSTLLSVMAEFACQKIIFSSSCTVYGEPKQLPVTEASPLEPVNPYGRSKLMVENMLLDLYQAEPAWAITMLRYFNPAGAHASGLIGEDPLGTPNNLLPYIAQVASGQRAQLSVFGDDYDTPDGTGVRDYVHVCDVADAHVKALLALNSSGGFNTYNIGTGRGYSVLEIIAAFENASGRSIPYTVAARRPGDVDECFADPAKIATQLGWRAQHDIEQMAQDLWRWQQNNSNNNHIGQAQRPTRDTHKNSIHTGRQR